MSNNTEKEEAISFEAFIKIIDMFKNNKILCAFLRLYKYFLNLTKLEY